MMRNGTRERNTNAGPPDARPGGPALDERTLLQHLQAGQFLALKELEGGTTAGGDMGEAIVREAKVTDRRSGVASTDDRECSCLGGIHQALGLSLIHI